MELTTTWISERASNDLIFEKKINSFALDIIDSYNFTEYDQDFDQLYPIRYRSISKIHWTPVDVIKIAVGWLNGKTPCKILDIGSGVGKFCLLGSILSKSIFVGVEKRKNLFEQSKKTAKLLEIKRVHFINENVVNIDFTDYDAFYYFNPFCEQIANSDWIDKKPTFSLEKYGEYEKHVFSQLKIMPKGTKVVTYCSNDFSLPVSYQVRNMMFDGLLVLWIKLE